MVSVWLVWIMSWSVTMLACFRFRNSETTTNTQCCHFPTTDTGKIQPEIQQLCNPNYPYWNITVINKTTARQDYNTTWDAILTCSQKLTWVSLIYSTEPTTKKWKTEKLKRKKLVCSEVSVNSTGNPGSPSWRRKGRLWWEGFLGKEGF